MLSLEKVLASLPPALQKVFEDSRVTELMINSPDSVWYERGGCLYPVYTEGLTSRDLEATALAIARPLGLDANKTAPIVDARLPDGSRVAIACPPHRGNLRSLDPALREPALDGRYAGRGRLSAPRGLGARRAGFERAIQHPHIRGNRNRQDNAARRSRTSSERAWPGDPC